MQNNIYNFLRLFVSNNNKKVPLNNSHYLSKTTFPIFLNALEIEQFLTCKTSKKKPKN